jgi:hypothetical protein
MPRATTTTRLRAEQVATLRKIGAEFKDVREYARRDDAENGLPWLGPNGRQLSDRQLWRICSLADDLVAEELERDRDKQFARHILARRLIRARALEVGDNRTALAALIDEARLLRLYPEQQKPKEPGQQVNIWAPLMASLTNEQLAALAGLAEKALALNGATNVDSRRPSAAPVEASFTPAAPGGDDPPGSLPPQLPDLCQQDADPE